MSGVGPHLPKTVCLGFHLEQLRPDAFWLPKPKKFTMLPTCWITTRMDGIESPGWRDSSQTEAVKR